MNTTIITANRGLSEAVSAIAKAVKATHTQITQTQRNNIEFVIARPKAVAISVPAKAPNILNAEGVRAQREAKVLGKIMKSFLEIILFVLTALLGMLMACWLLMGLTELPIWGDDMVYEYEDIILYFIELLLIAVLFAGCFKTHRKLNP